LPNVYGTVVAECQTASDCDDENACTIEECNDGFCQLVGQLVCSQPECGTIECNPSTGQCEFAEDEGPNCGPGNECTDRFCEEGTCVTVVDDNFCDDENACTFGDFCDPDSGCRIDIEINCGQFECGISECNPSTGQCELEENDEQCGLDNECTDRSCEEGFCVTVVDAGACDVIDECIVGFCDTDQGCIGDPGPFNGEECDGGDGLCTDGECIPQVAEIHVLKFNDLNGNGEQDAGEPGIPGWEITLDCADGTSDTQLTDANGMVWFVEIQTPNSCTVSEEQRDEWNPTTSPNVLVELNQGGDDITVVFGNIRALETEKFYTETDKDFGNNFIGTPLPFTDDGTQTVQAVIHPKTGKITSYNPGQYYAVTKVTAFVDLATVWIFEEDFLCTEGDKPISIWNPNKVPGGAYVAMMCPDGTTVDLTSELADADPPQLFRNDLGVLEAHVEDVKAGCMVFLGVKYSPGLKGVNVEDVDQLSCENWEIVCANLTHEDNGIVNASTENDLIACISDVTDSAHRVLEVVKCGENEEEDPLGECVCIEGFEETPSGICVAAEF